MFSIAGSASISTMPQKQTGPTILFLQDGDRRWAEREGVSYREGYEKMTEKIGLLINTLAKKGINKLYLPSNSIANLSRPKEQVDAWFEAYLNLPKYVDVPLNIIFCGDVDRIPEEFKDRYDQLQASSDPEGFEFHFLLNWSTLDEIARISTKIAKEHKVITPELLLQYSDIPEPVDLVVRSGKRRRISSFMPLSGQYSELVFLDILFPDLTESDVEWFLEEYATRERTYGK